MNTHKYANYITNLTSWGDFQLETAKIAILSPARGLAFRSLSHLMELYTFRVKDLGMIFSN
jgi:hypothetical protein